MLAKVVCDETAEQVGELGEPASRQMMRGNRPTDGLYARSSGLYMVVSSGWVSAERNDCPRPFPRTSLGGDETGNSGPKEKLPSGFASSRAAKCTETVHSVDASKTNSRRNFAEASETRVSRMEFFFRLTSLRIVTVFCITGGCGMVWRGTEKSKC